MHIRHQHASHDHALGVDVIDRIAGWQKFQVHSVERNAEIDQFVVPFQIVRNSSRVASNIARQKLLFVFVFCAADDEQRIYKLTREYSVGSTEQHPGKVDSIVHRDQLKLRFGETGRREVASN